MSTSQAIIGECLLTVIVISESFPIWRVSYLLVLVAGMVAAAKMRWLSPPDG